MATKPCTEQNPTPHEDPPLIRRWIRHFGLLQLNRISNHEKLGFEGLRSPIGGEIDPPMWGTVLILAPYPTTLVFSVWPNFTSVKSYMPTNIGPQLEGGCAETYGTEVRGNLWDALYIKTVSRPHVFA
jgi:hypothetical protein